MAAKAYVLVKAAEGRTGNVRDALVNLEEVQEAHIVNGLCDIIAVVEGEDMKAVGNLVTRQILLLADVVRAVIVHVVSRT